MQLESWQPVAETQTVVDLDCSHRACTSAGYLLMSPSLLQKVICESHRMGHLALSFGICVLAHGGFCRPCLCFTALQLLLFDTRRVQVSGIWLLLTGPMPGLRQ